MSTLDRRLTALEAIAEEVRLRPYRELAAEHGIPLDVFIQMVEDSKAERARLNAEGVTDREIFERSAAECGMDPDELLRAAEELAARLNGL